ncbi:unnamed protein product [Ranitomeya imitator]|uniref:Uncharacterized protein n=1 Tax=Ranitomeya imitator TaxID=111125 RepID=A0ABN9KR10_9NEOB|nr:unnamed protein product [Ranitomeya imitator]
MITSKKRNNVSCLNNLALRGRVLRRTENELQPNIAASRCLANQFEEDMPCQQEIYRWALGWTRSTKKDRLLKK